MQPVENPVTQQRTLWLVSTRELVSIWRCQESRLVLELRSCEREEFLQSIKSECCPECGFEYRKGISSLDFGRSTLAYLPEWCDLLPRPMALSPGYILNSPFKKITNALGPPKPNKTESLRVGPGHCYLEKKTNLLVPLICRQDWEPLTWSWWQIWGNDATSPSQSQRMCLTIKEFFVQ